jgi:hypothetical protein
VSNTPNEEKRKELAMIYIMDAGQLLEPSKVSIIYELNPFKSA